LALSVAPTSNSGKCERKLAVLALPEGDMLRASSMVYLKSFLAGVIGL
jgi:hypothetical protein